MSKEREDAEREKENVERERVCTTGEEPERNQGNRGTRKREKEHELM